MTCPGIDSGKHSDLPGAGVEDCARSEYAAMLSRMDLRETVFSVRSQFRRRLT